METLGDTTGDDDTQRNAEEFRFPWIISDASVHKFPGIVGKTDSEIV